MDTGLTCKLEKEIIFLSNRKEDNIIESRTQNTKTCAYINVGMEESDFPIHVDEKGNKLPGFNCQRKDMA